MQALWLDGVLTPSLSSLPLTCCCCSASSQSTSAASTAASSTASSALSRAIQTTFSVFCCQWSDSTAECSTITDSSSSAAKGSSFKRFVMLLEVFERFREELLASWRRPIAGAGLTFGHCLVAHLHWLCELVWALASELSAL